MKFDRDKLASAWARFETSPWYRWMTFKFGMFLGVIIGMVIEAFWIITALVALGKL